MEFILDIGGEGRHKSTWNLNPRGVKTLGPKKGQPIPRHLSGRADAIPLPDDSVDLILVERTPLTASSLHELARVISPTGRIILRHAVLPWKEVHDLAKSILPGAISGRLTQIDQQTVMETEFQEFRSSSADCDR